MEKIVAQGLIRNTSLPTEPHPIPLHKQNNIEALEGGSQYIPLIILKISHIPKINKANIHKIQIALYPHIPKIDPSIPYPFE